MKNDYDRIKDLYGEKMAKFCRSNFPTIMAEGKMFDILYSTFAPTKVLYLDIIKNIYQEKNFMTIINSVYQEMKDKGDTEIVETNLTPEELMRSKGYILKECKTVEDVAEYKKYYKPSESLCTFNNIEGRLRGYRVFFAVKENVDEIKREDFSNPQRQDEYGTSVISLQFHKGVHSLSIKNRYNHSVENPDFTFDNNLENICEGLTKSFEKHYGIVVDNSENETRLTNYIKANDGKFYRYICEKNNIYLCADNVILKDYRPIRVDKSRFLVFNYFILDRKKKKIISIDEGHYYIYGGDSFPKHFDNLKRKIEKIDVQNTESGKVVRLHILQKNPEENYAVEFHLNEYNEMITYIDNHSTIIPASFLETCKSLKDVYITNARIIEPDAFGRTKLEKLVISNVEEIGNSALYFADNLKEFNAPKLESVGNDVLHLSRNIERIYVPNLKFIGDNFLFYNQKIKEADFPSLVLVGNNLFADNINIQRFSAPNLKTVGSGLLKHARKLTEFNASNVEQFGYWCLSGCKILKALSIPKCENVGVGFLEENKDLEYLNILSLKSAGVKFLAENKSLKKFIAPALELLQSDALSDNSIIEEVYAPNLKAVGDHCFNNNLNVKKANFPSLESVGMCFFGYNVEMEQFYAPQLKRVPSRLFSNNKNMKDFYCPELSPCDIRYILPLHNKAFSGENDRFVIYGLTNKDENFKDLIWGGYNLEENRTSPKKTKVYVEEDGDFYF